MENKTEDPDALLNASVRCYSPGPQAGIEDRVLRSVRARKKRPKRFSIWLALVPIAALLLIAFALRNSQAPLSIATTPARITTPAPLPPSIPPAAKNLQKRRRRAPRLPAPFPTPAPLTNEERMLQLLAVRDPSTAQALLARNDDRPLEIKTLEITPLDNNEVQ